MYHVGDDVGEEAAASGQGTANFGEWNLGYTIPAG
jgi:hypothetical protein